MQKEVIDFINSQFLSVLSLEMPDGAPHAATMHFAFSENPRMFLFETYRPHKKSEALFSRPESRASLVIGFDEKSRRTLQLDDEARLLLDDTERLLFNKIYFKRFPNKKEKSKDPKFVFFAFLPRWWRFTDWDAPGGKLVLTSEDK